MSHTRNFGLKALGCTTALALVMAAGAAQAEDDMVSGAAGLSYNSHFISYGGDVWGGGDEFFGDNSTTFAWFDLGYDFTSFTLNVGVWGDINDNAPSGLGGSFQEIDWYASLGYGIGPFGFGLTYQEWNYGADVEGILDFAVSFDDSSSPFPVSPKLTWHNRIDQMAGQGDGSALVLSLGPSFSLTESLSLTIPLNFAYFLDDFGADDGYAYTSGGLSFGFPLPFLGTAHGEWSANFDLIYYMTDDGALPGNPEDDFLTGAFGISTSF